MSSVFCVIFWNMCLAHHRNATMNEYTKYICKNKLIHTKLAIILNAKQWISIYIAWARKNERENKYMLVCIVYSMQRAVAYSWRPQSISQTCVLYYSNKNEGYAALIWLLLIQFLLFGHSNILIYFHIVLVYAQRTQYVQNIGPFLWSYQIIIIVYVGKERL